MNTNIIVQMLSKISLASLLSPTITLILGIYKILKTRQEKTTTPRDTALKILKMSREAIDLDKYKEIRKSRDKFKYFLFFANIISAILLILVSICVIIYVIVFHTTAPLVGFFLLIGMIINALSLWIFNIYKNTTYNMMFFPNYDLFNKLEVIIEADFHYLITKCHSTLKSMNMKIIEIKIGNSESKLLAVYESPFTLQQPQRIIVMVERTKDTLSSYAIHFENYQITDMSYKNKDLSKQHTDFFKSIKLTNSFMERLISKPHEPGDKKN